MADIRIGEDAPFRSEKEEDAWDHRVPVHIRVGPPRVNPHVVPRAGTSGTLTKDDFVVSFLVVWQPAPIPPPHWVKLMREAPFGSGLVHARDLHWNGHHLSIELVREQDVEAFASEMQGWVDYANAEYTRGEHGPAVDALLEAKRRAADLQHRLQR